MLSAPLQKELLLNALKREFKLNINKERQQLAGNVTPFDANILFKVRDA